MNQQNYNRFFHLHTVSGIVISVALYVIFFAGAFTLFEDEIDHWEEGKYTLLDVQEISAVKDFDYDRFVASLEKEDYDLYGRDIFINLSNDNPIDIYVSKSKVKDTLLTKDANKHYDLDVDANYKITEQVEEANAFSLGTLLYWLHFFSQARPIGMYVAGLVSLFFLFAIVTGIIVHWKKIVSNFYTFRPLAKLKTIWTDSHTVLGVIGIPFQFMYALTGAMFCLGIVIAPTILLYDGGFEDVKKDLGFQDQDSVGIRTNIIYKLNPYVEETTSKWDDFVPSNVSIQNYDSDNMQLIIRGNVDTKTAVFGGGGTMTYNLATGEIVSEENPAKPSYFSRVHQIANSLHYANYGKMGALGDYGLRIIYFILAIITCFVIISGVLIWLTARDKKNVPEKQRRYNEKVGHIYLAICLTMLPITAFSFIVSKLLPESMIESREVILNSVFFGGWLLLFVFFWLKKNNYFTNKCTLLSGGILGICIPLVNGFSSGNWLWRTFAYQNYDIFVLDILWIFISACTLYAVYRMKSPKNPPQTKKEIQKEDDKIRMV